MAEIYRETRREIKGEIQHEEDPSDRAYWQRAFILLSTRQPEDFATPDELERFIADVEERAELEDKFSEQNVDAYPSAFPERWAARIDDALTLNPDFTSLFLDEMLALSLILKISMTAGDEIATQGLPISAVEFTKGVKMFSPLFDDSSIKRHRKLAGQDHPVVQFERASMQFAVSRGRIALVRTWNEAVERYTERIRKGEIVVDVQAHKAFLEASKDEPDDISGSLAEPGETIEDLDVLTTRLGILADAVAILGVGSLIRQLTTGGATLDRQRKLFTSLCDVADGKVARLSETDRVVRALEWSFAHGYVGDEAMQMMKLIREFGWREIRDTLAMLAFGILGGPVGQSTLAAYGLTWTATTIDGVLNAASSAQAAESVLMLQRAAWRFAAPLAAGAASLATHAIGLGLKGIAARAAVLKKADPRLTDEQAMKKALNEHLKKMASTDPKAWSKLPAALRIATLNVPAMKFLHRGPYSVRLKSPDGTLAEIARSLRATQTTPTLKEFEGNIAVLRVRIGPEGSGTIVYLEARNLPAKKGKIHSERYVMQAQLHDLRKQHRGKEVVPEQLYTERSPCWTECRPYLDSQFPEVAIWYSVEHGRGSAKALMKQYMD